MYRRSLKTQNIGIQTARSFSWLAQKWHFEYTGGYSLITRRSLGTSSLFRNLKEENGMKIAR